ncbi:unnamed protein product [Hapterophycus canaliculatus]
MMLKAVLCGVVALLPASLGFVVPTASSSAFARGGKVAHVSATSAAVSSPTMGMERSYIMIKPDGVQRGLVGTIISRFEQRGYKLTALKLKQADEALLKTHYKDLVEKPFFPALLAYMISGPVVCMAWEGKDAVAMGRKMLGETNPLASAPGTIRGDFALEVR